MARLDLLHTLTRQVDQSVAAEAVVLTGGGRFDHTGFFYQPTVLAHVKSGMPVLDEETFGRSSRSSR
jgi:succinate-semialdehyde dehydrogenase/glutarate-semialdehyde dehydrogenase